MKTCPHCSCLVANDFWLCTCGYEFADPLPVRTIKSSLLTLLKIVLMVVGAVLIYMALVLFTSWPVISQAAP